MCGHETAGWVAEVGAGVRNVSVGDAVLLHPLATCGFRKACRAGDDMHCTAGVVPGVFAPGGFAEYVKTNARALVRLPDNLTPAQVAPLGDAGLTAYRAVRKSLPLAVPGTRTVVLGAGGWVTSASRPCAHCPRPTPSWSTATRMRSTTRGAGEPTTPSW